MLTGIGILVIVWLVVALVWWTLNFFFYPAPNKSPSFFLSLIWPDLVSLSIASVVEIALFWLLVVLNIISIRNGIAATLALFILVGITVFIVFTSAY